MARKSCHKGTKMTCGPEYELYVEKCKKQHGKAPTEMYLYKNGAIGAFLEDGRFLFLRGSDKNTLASLRAMRGKKSSKKSASMKSSSKKSSSMKSSSMKSETKPITVGGAINLLNNFYKKQNKSSSSSSSKKSSKKSNKASKKSNKASKKSSKKSSKK